MNRHLLVPAMVVLWFAAMWLLVRFQAWWDRHG
jgi:hypothetical protein